MDNKKDFKFCVLKYSKEPVCVVQCIKETHSTTKVLVSLQHLCYILVYLVLAWIITGLKTDYK